MTFLPDFSTPPTTGALQKALQTQGCFLLRDCLPLPWLRAAKIELEKRYAAADQDWQAGRMSEAAYQKLFQYGHLPEDGTFVPLAGFSELVGKLYAPLLASPVLLRFLRAFWGETVFFIAKNSLPRRQHPFWPERQIPFHQDAEFLGGRPALNFWMPLNPCGRHAPGLELWLVPQQQVWFERPSDPLTPLSQQRDISALMRASSRAQFWRPEMEPGDLLVFDAYLFHRTWLNESMFEPRYSLEIRLTHPAFAPGLIGREWRLSQEV